MNKVYIHPYNYRGEAIDTTSRSKTWSKQLSPFYLGPVKLYDNFSAKNVENAWQYSKVYEEDVDQLGNPSESYWKWAKAGWAKYRADRYPKEKGRKPLYCYWAGEKLSYVQARLKVYCPLYANTVEKTEAYANLVKLFKQGNVHLRDFDAYDHYSLGITFKDVLLNENKKAGHGFVLAMMLMNERVWENYE